MSEGKGRGWHGDSEAHAAAGRLGGKVSGGRFQTGNPRASEASKKGVAARKKRRDLARKGRDQ